MTGVVGVLASGLRSVESTPFSVEKKVKGVARSWKAPTKVQSTKATKPTRLLASQLQGVFLGWFLPSSLLEQLLLRFLVVLSPRCHYLTESNRHTFPVAKGFRRYACA